MIKTLQIKFVVTSMLSLFVVLSLIITGINIVNYNGVVDSADELLVLLSEHKGRFPKNEPLQGAALPPHMTQETPYETRYFSVLLRNSGEIVQVETGSIASIGTSEAIDLAKHVLTNNSPQGFVHSYRYLKTVRGGTSHIIFLDCESRLHSFYDFLIASCIISLFGYVIVGVLIAVLSSRIIRPIAESYEKQKRFITDAGHEIKTPLTIINADADVLEMEYGRNEWLDDIQMQADRLAALTNDLVYLARMEEAENAAKMIEFPISDAVRETATSFLAPAQMKNKNIICEIQPMLTLRGDEKAIRQLVSILLDNAVKYSKEGSNIIISLEKQNKALRLSVYNPTEAEIMQETLEHLFDRFYRADPSRNSQINGYGIGLSIAKAVVAAHGGKINAKTADGGSLTINITLPL